MLLVAVAHAAQAAEPGAGQRIYMEKCASCHGAAGEGTAEGYDKPLAGDRPLDQLASYITESMPEDDPQACVGDEAAAVARYIFDAFYSQEARSRQDRPRVALARLTVRQYQSALADLLASPAPPIDSDGARGLRGEYFGDRRFRDDQRVIDRLDETIDFDFAESSPEPDAIDAEDFSIRWTGSVRVPETGEYEFILRTANGARLWVNNPQRPLIDAWVRSGTDIVRRESIRLLGGRAYPLRLEFFKSKKAKERVASIRLIWKPPLGIEAPIGSRYLSPASCPPTYVVSTAFPPDDRSVGYERGTSVSKQWDESTTSAALEVAAYVAAHLPELADASADAPDMAQRVREYCYCFAERALRRPLTEEQRQFYVDQHFVKHAGADGEAIAGAQASADEAQRVLEASVKKVVLLVLKSPRFLYRETGAAEWDAYDVASRISFGAWDSLPDAPLLEAAAAGQLETREQVLQQARRMIDDPRARSKLRRFFHQWLHADRIDDVSKDAALFPEFDAAAVSDLRTSLDMFLDDVIWSEASDFRQLFLADYLYLNGRLAHIYGVDLPADARFQKVSLDGARRAGLLSHPFLMTGFAYHATSSPIHRGVFVARSLLGRVLRPPPEAVAPLAPELHPDLTTRARVELQTHPASCMSCHGMINSLGFALEHYDAIGRYRDTEQGRPIDAAGSYETLQGTKVELNGARSLAEFLSSSDDAHKAFVQQLFHHMIQQPIRAFEPDPTDVLLQSFAENGYNVRNLLAEIVVASSGIR